MYITKPGANATITASGKPGNGKSWLETVASVNIEVLSAQVKSFRRSIRVPAH